MHTKIQQWGNSLALRIPKIFAEEAGLQRHREVDVSVENGKVVIFPLHAPTLDELLAEVTEQNLHGETDTGFAVGGEAW